MKMPEAFNEWMRRYTEHPEDFAREWEVIRTFLKQKGEGEEPTYGDKCARYLEFLMGERR